MKKYFDYRTESVRLGQLFSDFANGVVEIPHFQRRFVWNKTLGEKYIESVLIGYPTPPLFMLELDDGRRIVLDGQQRLLSIIWFLYPYYFESDAGGFKAEYTSTVLARMKGTNFSYVIPEIERRKYIKVDAEKVLGWRNNAGRVDTAEIAKYGDAILPVLNATVPVMVAKYNGPEEEFEKHVAELFKRINKNKIRLSDMDVYAAVYYNKEYFDLIDAIAHDPLVNLVERIGNSNLRKRNEMDTIIRFDMYYFGLIDVDRLPRRPTLDAFKSYASIKESLHPDFFFSQEQVGFEAFLKNRKIFYERAPKEWKDFHKRHLMETFKNAVKTFDLVMYDSTSPTGKPINFELKKKKNGKISHVEARLLPLFAMYSNRYMKLREDKELRKKLRKDIVHTFTTGEKVYKIVVDGVEVDQKTYREIFHSSTAGYDRVVASWKIMLDVFLDHLGEPNLSPYGKEYRKYREEVKQKILSGERVVCHICGKPIERVEDLHIDHVKPVAEGGKGTYDNLAPAHVWCNIRKSSSSS